MSAGEDAFGYTVAIIGLGLIGGSLARALTRRGTSVLGFDTDAQRLDAAVRAGVARNGGDVADADIVVIAAPVDAAVRVLHELAPRLHRARLVTDAGSTKASIVAAAGELGIGTRFVGAHPLAGDHRSGFDAARADLFEGETVYLTPTPATHTDAIALAVQLWTCAGAIPQHIDAAGHDALLARTSHLPQLLASALALVLDDAGITPDQLGRGGRDMTRLAGSSAELWTPIALDNATALDDAFGALEQQIAAARHTLRRGQADRLQAWLRRAAEWTRRA